MTAPTPRRLVPATATGEMEQSGVKLLLYPEFAPRVYDAMLASSPHAGRVSREEVKVGIRAHYNAPEFYEPSVQAMEGAIRFLEALGLEIEPAQEAGGV